MKVDELRGVLSQYDQGMTTKLAVELYKMIPKRVRDDNGLDDFIRTFPVANTSLRSARSTNQQPIDFGALRQEVETFLQYAAAGYYFQPNRIVSKTARSKWRFTARRLIKSLVATRGDDTDEAALLLAEMWRALCYTCIYYTFPTEAPFSAVGHAQPDLLDIVLAKLFSVGVTERTMRLAVWLVLESQVDRETLPSDLQSVLIVHLKTVDMKQAALDECRFFAEHFKDPASCPYPSKRFRPTYSRQGFAIDYSRAAARQCAELYLRISIALREYATGIEYFKDHFVERSREVSLFCLLAVIHEYIDGDPQLAETWVEVYDDAVKRGVSPRSQLVEQRSVIGRVNQ